MTGAYLRAKRDGKWENIEVEHLPPAERRELLAPRSMDEVMRWMDMLCEQVAENQTLFDGLVADGDGILAKRETPPPGPGVTTNGHE